MTIVVDQAGDLCPSYGNRRSWNGDFHGIFLRFGNLPGHETEGTFLDIGRELVLFRRIVDELINRHFGTRPQRKNGFIDQQDLQAASVGDFDLVTEKDLVSTF